MSGGAALLGCASHGWLNAGGAAGQVYPSCVERASPFLLERQSRPRTRCARKGKARTHIDTNLPRPYAVVHQADALAQLIEHLRGLKNKQQRSAAFHNYLILVKAPVQLPENQSTTCS